MNSYFSKYQKYKKKYLKMKEVYNKIGGDYDTYKNSIDDYLKKPNSVTIQMINTIKDKIIIQSLIEYLITLENENKEKYEGTLPVVNKTRIEYLNKELANQMKKIENLNKKKPKIIVPIKEENRSTSPSSSGATGFETKEEINKNKKYEKFKEEWKKKFYQAYNIKTGKVSESSPIIFEPKNQLELLGVYMKISLLVEEEKDRSIIIPPDWYENYDFYLAKELV